MNDQFSVSLHTSTHPFASATRAGTVEDVKIAHLLLFTPFTVTYTSLNDRNRMIGIVINRKQEYNISVKQYLSESYNLNGDKKWITENSANAIT